MKNFFTYNIDDMIDRHDIKPLVAALKDIKDEEQSEMAIKAFITNMFVEYQYKQFAHDISNVKTVDREFNTQPDYSVQEFDSAGYIDCAQAFGDIIKEINPTRIFAGPAASSYLRLLEAFESAQSYPVGIAKIGTIYDADVYKAPAMVIPNNIVYVENMAEIIKYRINGIK